MSHFRFWINELKLMVSLSIPGAVMEIAFRLQYYLVYVFLGHLSNYSMQLITGVYVASFIWNYTGYNIITCMATTLEMYCSQSNGAKNYEQIGIYFLRANIFTLLTYFPLWALYIHSDALVALFITDQVSFHSFSAFIKTMCYGYPGFCFYMLAFKLLQSQYVIFVNLLILLFGVTTNMILQYVFLYVLMWGVHGSALAVSISFYVTSVCYIAYILLSGMHRKLKLKISMKPLEDWWHYAKNVLLNFGVRICIDAPLLICLIVIILVGNDALQVATFGYISLLWGLESSFCYGLGIGASTRVGNLLGAYNPKQAKQSALFIIVFGFGVSIFVSLLITCLSTPISLVFTSNERVQYALSTNIQYCMPLMIFDFIYVFQGVFYGCGLTKYSLPVFIVTTLFIVLPASSLLAYYWEYKVLGFAISFQCGLIVCGFLFLLIFVCSDWNKLSKTAVGNANLNNNSAPENNDLIISPQTKPRLIYNIVMKSNTFLTFRFLFTLSFGVCLFVISYMNQGHY